MEHRTRGVPNALTTLISNPTNYWAGMLLDAVVAGALLGHAIRILRWPWQLDVALLTCGLGLYGLVEYLSHRLLYHAAWSPAVRGHRLHHEEPRALIALPCFVTSVIALAVWLGLGLVVGAGAAAIVVAALLIGFLFYGVVHHALHHGHPSWWYLRVLSVHHEIHHDFPNRNFGVTMTFWDRAFRTHHLVMRGPGTKRRATG